MKPEEIPARDQYGRLLEDRGVWRQATTLDAAGELTARWLEGGSSYQPGHFAAGYDDETNPIAAALAELNRNGLFTKESQPGILDGGAAQRQYVTGFCSAATAGELLALSTRTELVTVAHAPGEASSAAIPVTLDGTEVVTVLGQARTRWTRSRSRPGPTKPTIPWPCCWQTPGTSKSWTRCGAATTSSCQRCWVH